MYVFLAILKFFVLSYFFFYKIETIILLINLNISISLYEKKTCYVIYANNYQL